MLKKHRSYYIAGFLILALAMISLVALPQQEQRPVSLAEFKKVTATKDTTVLVYFSADWCAVCRKMKPIIKAVEDEYKGRIKTLHIDTERDKEVADEYEVNSLPIIMLYKNGSREWIHVGIIQQKDIEQKIEGYFY